LRTTPRDDERSLLDAPLKRTVGGIDSFFLHRPNLRDSLSRSSGTIAEFLNAEFALTFLKRHSDRDDFEFVSSVTFCSSDVEAVTGIPAGAMLPPSISQRILNARYAEILSDQAQDLTAISSELDVESMLGVPLADGRSLWGVLLICNYDSRLSLDELRVKLRPLLATFNDLAQAPPSSPSPRFAHMPNASNEPSLAFSALDAMFDAVLLVGQKGIIEFCNEQACQVLACHREDLIGMDLNELMPEQWLEVEASGLEQDAVRNVNMHRFDGRYISLDVRVFRVSDTSLTGLVFSDASVQDAYGDPFEEDAEHFETITSIVPVAIVEIDASMRSRFVNAMWCSLSGRSAEDSIGTRWLDALEPRDAQQVIDRLRAALDGDRSFSEEFRLTNELGETVWVSARGRPLDDRNGRPQGMVLVMHDITEHREATRQLQHAAETDPLTRLGNRSSFFDRLDDALRRAPRSEHPIVVLYVDVDGFKQVNDSLGHATGDQLLIDIGKRILSVVRESDTVARLGGDEFALLLDEVKSIRAVQRIAETLITTLGKRFSISEREIRVTVSIGIAVSGIATTPRSVLMRQADTALYKAKEAGKNQYRFYTPEYEQDAQLHRVIRGSLMQRVNEDFDLTYQPFIDADSGEVLGVEALTRWRPAKEHHTDAAAVVKMIDESGLTEDFVAWQADRVARDCGRWIRDFALPPTFRVNLNLSARQIHFPDLAPRILEQLQVFSVPSEVLTFEVSEAAINVDIESARKTLQSLRDMHFGLALDDFGTGYSSLSNLRDLPVDMIKIDRRYVQRILEDRVDAAIVHSIIDLTQSLGLELVAEGIENDEVRAWLLKRGCTYHQGFFYHQPMTAENLERTVLSRLEPREAQGQ